jgi:hypothetical protein
MVRTADIDIRDCSLGHAVALGYILLPLAVLYTLANVSDISFVKPATFAHTTEEVSWFAQPIHNSVGVVPFRADEFEVNKGVVLFIPVLVVEHLALGNIYSGCEPDNAMQETAETASATGKSNTRISVPRPAHGHKIKASLSPYRFGILPLDPRGSVLEINGQAGFFDGEGYVLLLGSNRAHGSSLPTEGVNSITEHGGSYHG